MTSPTDSGRRSIWVQVAAALLPVVWWGLLTVTLGQPLHQSFISMPKVKTTGFSRSALAIAVMVHAVGGVAAL